MNLKKIYPRVLRVMAVILFLGLIFLVWYSHKTHGEWNAGWQEPQDSLLIDHSHIVPEDSLR